MHGLLGSSNNWRSLISKLGQDRRVLALDLRNHGSSPHAPAMPIEAMAEDVGAFMNKHNINECALLGHSLGGKVAMQFALDHPDRIEKLCVVDIAPVSYSASDSSWRSAAHVVESLARLDISNIKSRPEADKMLQAYLPDKGIRAFVLQNLVSVQGGPLQWRMNLEVIASSLDGVAAFPATTGTYPGQTLFINGENSKYVVWERDQKEILAKFPLANLHTIPTAGHWVHAEAPGPFLAAANSFLAA